MRRNLFAYVHADASELIFGRPENVPRLFDLIRVQDQRIRPAFYHAVRETLVADSLDQASRIAYGATRYRVVTLAGELIEVSGMFTRLILFRNRSHKIIVTTI